MIVTRASFQPIHLEILLEDNCRVFLKVNGLSGINSDNPILNWEIQSERALSKSEIKEIDEKIQEVKAEMEDIFYFGSVIRK